MTDYRDLLADTDALKHTEEASGGCLEHVALKILGNRYLETLQISSVYEHPFCGYYPDVLASDHSVIIECGHTANPEKLLHYFKQSDITRVIQVPYPDHEDTEIMGYEFHSQSTLREFLTFRDSERSRSIKDIIKRR
jgi:hypothetical protein